MEGPLVYLSRTDKDKVEYALYQLKTDWLTPNIDSRLADLLTCVEAMKRTPAGYRAQLAVKTLDGNLSPVTDTVAKVPHRDAREPLFLRFLNDAGDIFQGPIPVKTGDKYSIIGNVAEMRAIEGLLGLRGPGPAGGGGAGGGAGGGFRRRKRTAYRRTRRRFQRKTRRSLRR